MCLLRRSHSLGASVSHDSSEEQRLAILHVSASADDVRSNTRVDVSTQCVPLFNCLAAIVRRPFQLHRVSSLRGHSGLVRSEKRCVPKLGRIHGIGLRSVLAINLVEGPACWEALVCTAPIKLGVLGAQPNGNCPKLL